MKNRLKIATILLVLTLITACSNSSKINQMKTDNEELTLKNQELALENQQLTKTNSQLMVSADDNRQEYDTLFKEYEKLKSSKNSTVKPNDKNPTSSTLTFKDNITMEVKILNKIKCNDLHQECIVGILVDEDHNTPFIISSHMPIQYSKLEIGKVYKLKVTVIVKLDKNHQEINFYL